MGDLINCHLNKFQDPEINKKKQKFDTTFGYLGKKLPQKLAET